MSPEKVKMIERVGMVFAGICVAIMVYYVFFPVPKISEETRKAEAEEVRTVLIDIVEDAGEDF